MNEVLVAVYGTLKRGKINHHWMRRAKGVFLSEASSTSNFKMWCDNGVFPYAVPCGEDEGCKIKVELYKVPESNIQILDMLEGYPSLYSRIDSTFKTLTGKIKALIYVPSNLKDRKSNQFPYIAEF